MALALIGTLVPVGSVRAQLTTCTVSYSPGTTNAQAPTAFSFGLYNSEPDAIRWIQISRPGGGDFVTLESAGAYAWDTDVTADTVTFRNGSLDQYGSQGFDVNGTTGTTTGQAASWQVQVSDDPDGANAITCDGDTNLTLEDVPTPVNIYGLMLTSVTPTSVTMYWNTDVPATGQVQYDEFGGYTEFTPLGAPLATGHGITLTGLKPATTYVYRVISTTPNGGTTMLDGNTFLTAEAPPPTPAPVIINNINNIIVNTTSASVPGVTIKTAPTETIPPVVTIDTKFEQSYARAPVITGTVSDNEAVARVEYSVDGGRNWLPVDEVRSLGRAGLASAALVSFRFTPAALDDGNYHVMVRAVDSSSNPAQTTGVTLVIDRLAPQVGTLAVAFGNQMLQPGNAGSFQLVTGTEYRLTTSAIGGPTSLGIEAVRATTPAAALAATAVPAASFSLTQSTATGLWSGAMQFQAGGAYQLVARGLDGAGRRTARVIGVAQVTAPGQVLVARTTRPVNQARATIYVRAATTTDWQVWQARPYGQSNPQAVSDDGRYGYMLPAGEYYMQVTAPGYRSYTSDVFKLNQPTAIAAPIGLSPVTQLRLGSVKLALPDLSWDSQPLRLVEPAAVNAAVSADSSLIGRPVPAFALTDLRGVTKRDLSYTGKPTVYSVVNTWSPDCQDQLAALAEAQANTNVHVVPVFVHQSAGAVSAYISTAGYRLNGLTDPDGLVVDGWRTSAAPQHLFVGRDGTVKALVVGLLSSQDLLTQLGGL